MSELKEKSKRNRTIVVLPSEVDKLEEKITTFENLREKFENDSIIHGDLLECIEYIPNNYFDLIIVDPPFYLSKDFLG